MSDPVFLITGASSGIGAATARLASQAGYRVVLAARSVDRLQELASELDGAERALALECDVTEWEQQQALVQTTLDRYGRLDVAFANAGRRALPGSLYSCTKRSSPRTSPGRSCSRSRSRRTST